MTYNQTLKEIARLKEELKKEGKVIGFEDYKVAVTECHGMGDFRETGEYKTYTKIIREENPNKKEIEEKIKTLENSIEEEKERRREKAKYNRYKKEVEELKKELEYKMKWIEDYEKAF